MKILRLYYKKIIKYFLFLTLAVFIFSNIFACHVYVTDSFQFIQKSLNDSHHSSGSCRDEKETLAQQDDPKITFTINRVYDQNNQKLNLTFDFIVSRKIPDLIRQKSPPLSLDELDSSSISHLSTIIKIE